VDQIHFPSCSYLHFSTFNPLHSLTSGNILKHLVLFLLYLQCISEVIFIYHIVLANKSEAQIATAAVYLVRGYPEPEFWLQFLRYFHNLRQVGEKEADVIGSHISDSETFQQPMSNLLEA